MLSKFDFKLILLSIFVFIILADSGLAQPYQTDFSINPREVLKQPGFVPYIEMEIVNGKVRNFCDYYHDYGCITPPPVKFAAVLKRGLLNPDCYDLIFGALWISTAWGVNRYGPGYVYENCDFCFFGLYGPCCLNFCNWWGETSGFTKYTVGTGPLVSGSYRVDLWTLTWPDWNPIMNRCKPTNPWAWWGLSISIS